MHYNEYNSTIGDRKMSNKIILELIAGEGGEDSKLFLKDMVKMYEGYCKAENFSLECL